MVCIGSATVRDGLLRRGHQRFFQTAPSAGSRSINAAHSAHSLISVARNN